MTAAVPADGDGVRVCRIHKRRQSFIFGARAEPFATAGTMVFRLKLREPGNWTSSRGSRRHNSFSTRRALMFSLCFLMTPTRWAGWTAHRRKPAPSMPTSCETTPLVAFERRRHLGDDVRQAISIIPRARATAWSRQRSPPVRARGRSAAPRPRATAPR